MSNESASTNLEIRGDSRRSTRADIVAGPRRPVKMWYMATPITTPSQSLQHLRGKAAARVAGYLLMKDMPLICPATHSIPIEEEWPKTSHFDWLKHDEEAFLKHCDGIIIVKLPGWDTSKGMRREYEYAAEHGLKVILYDPRHLFTVTEWNALQSKSPEPDLPYTQEGNLVDDLKDRPLH